MTDQSPLSGYLARPGQSLEKHLSGVDTAGATLIDDGGQTAFGDNWSEVMRTLAWTHDIGKLTEYFQTYVRTGSRADAPKAELTYHGRFGGFVTLLALAAQGMSKETAAAGFFAVTKHHSVLPNMRSTINEYGGTNRQHITDRYDNAQRQLENVDSTASEAADVVLKRATGGTFGWFDFTTQGLETVRAALTDIRQSGFTESFYGCTLRAWATLVAADKSDASRLADASSFSEIRRPDSRALDGMVRGLSKTTLDDGSTAATYLETPNKRLPGRDTSLEQRLAALRTASNERAKLALQNHHAAGDRVFEITLPTGFGKTYSGLRAALSLADKLDSRVVYSLPYTSIIDQVDKEIQDVFGLSPLDPEYTIHHHLADTRTILESPSSGRETLHAESWRSGLILTTFTQLFESVAGPQNVQSMKLPALQDSVILIDEPQALSLDWWALLGRLTEYLSDEYNATIVFMTATQPRILEHLDGPDPKPLVNLQDDCAALLTDAPRVTFQLHESLQQHLDTNKTEPLSLADAADELDDAVGESTNLLSIVNTVGCAAELSEHLTEDRLALGEKLLTYLQSTNGQFDAESYLAYLAEHYPDTSSLVVSLTTRLRPIDRQALLQCLSRILDTETETPFDNIPTITVSTQLIEAGVDISFDRLYRDYGPIPAIVQAAGRCNRRFGGPAASVTIWRLDSPNGADYIPSQLIYGQRSLLRPTRTALAELRGHSAQTTLSESQMLTLGVETYYENLHNQRRTAERGDGLATAFDQAEGEKLRNASVVSQDFATQDVFVLVTDDDVTTHESYEQNRASQNWVRAKDDFQQLKSTLVSVPVKEESQGDQPLVVKVGDYSEDYDIKSGLGVILDGFSGDLEV
ncbi:CRISPR-associated endonuclease Cas3'' [Haloferax sp. ATB1]|uniref:CRISPR-associated endonuclease Cas3'' n=1 Tax=Haloferax sp. ATB1 TaxID=1508454 RepID=UPI0009E58FC8|nr:CRISPR-associated endonuclease Cas3'' [Haloferax sp. ATB1]